MKQSGFSHNTTQLCLVELRGYKSLELEETHLQKKKNIVMLLCVLHMHLYKYLLRVIAVLFHPRVGKH